MEVYFLIALICFLISNLATLVTFYLLFQKQQPLSQNTKAIKIAVHSFDDEQRFYKIPFDAANNVVTVMKNRGFEVYWLQKNGVYFDILFRKIRKGEMNGA